MKMLKVDGSLFNKVMLSSKFLDQVINFLLDNMLAVQLWKHISSNNRQCWNLVKEADIESCTTSSHHQPLHAVNTFYIEYKNVSETNLQSSIDINFRIVTNHVDSWKQTIFYFLWWLWIRIHTHKKLFKYACCILEHKWIRFSIRCIFQGMLIYSAVQMSRNE